MAEQTPVDDMAQETADASSMQDNNIQGNDMQDNNAQDNNAQNDKMRESNTQDDNMQENNTQDRVVEDAGHSNNTDDAHEQANHQSKMPERDLSPSEKRELRSIHQAINSLGLEIFDMTDPLIDRARDRLVAQTMFPEGILAYEYFIALNAAQALPLQHAIGCVEYRVTSGDMDKTRLRHAREILRTLDVYGKRYEGFSNISGVSGSEYGRLGYRIRELRGMLFNIVREVYMS